MVITHTGGVHPGLTNPGCTANIETGPQTAPTSWPVYAMSGWRHRATCGCEYCNFISTHAGRCVSTALPPACVTAKNTRGATMNDKSNKPPEIIYLQCYDEHDSTLLDPVRDDVTWCVDRVNDNDAVYVLAPVQPPRIPLED